ncbi:hypothetical protein VP01_1127g2 [Puccinia sorghi]|uniref:Uncharacterized protein n=1 Tax=Puccinia sorghi TaxID=27349 RepID=A0A0L6VS96_9BASI|nr:hypothetical protein VP01_1127g2 [Puccinia sorghi]
MMKLLLPLSKANNITCASKCPTLKKALPIYIVLIKHLKQVQHGLYEQAQLIQPALKIINKIEQYLLDTIQKPCYFCSMIPDPICQREPKYSDTGPVVARITHYFLKRPKCCQIISWQRASLNPSSVEELPFVKGSFQLSGALL